MVAELLAQEAVAAGMADDPRVEYAIAEEIAEVFVSAELERRVPHAPFATDEAALRAHYEAQPELFVVPERRATTAW